MKEGNSEPASDSTSVAPASADGDAPTKQEGEEPPVRRVPKKRIVRRRRHKDKEQEPLYVDLLDTLIAQSGLPVPSYQLELPKTVHRICQLKAQHVALQLPEGLLLYATVLADLLQQVCASSSCCQQVSVLGDVTYGACCIDDVSAQALGADLLVHYGHSCLVPIQHTVIPCHYVFVEVQVSVDHCVNCLQATLQQQAAAASDSHPNLHFDIYLLGTVQFRHALVAIKQKLEALEDDDSSVQKYDSTVSIPQVKPLSPGEVLGCTSPVLPKSVEPNSKSIVCFVADGRFHLESTMMANADTVDIFYQYDPYTQTLSEQVYEQQDMLRLRRAAIQQAKAASTFGIVLGTLGRQGNPAIVQQLQRLLDAHGKRHVLYLVSELTPARLQVMEDGGMIGAWVQVACPRLSVDWGHLLSPDKPVLNPFELFVCFNETDWKGGSYPMDYYSLASQGPWSNYFGSNKERQYCDKCTDD